MKIKKILCLFGVAALTLSSCASDDNNSENEASAIVPKTVKYSDIDNPSENTLYTSNYDGIKLLSTTDEAGRSDYTYDGNLLVKEINYDTESEKGKDVISDETTYTYTNGKLTSSTYVESFSASFPTGEYKSRKVYTHNTDGTVKVEIYRTNSKTGLEEKSNYFEVLTYANGNLVKSVETNTDSNTTFTAVYEYDTKNNPFKNVLGYNLLIDHSEGEGSLSSVNNVVKYTATYSDNSDVSVYKSEYVYDANGYPTKSTSYKKDGVKIYNTNEYTY